MDGALPRAAVADQRAQRARDIGILRLAFVLLEGSRGWSRPNESIGEIEGRLVSGLGGVSSAATATAQTTLISINRAGHVTAIPAAVRAQLQRVLA